MLYKSDFTIYQGFSVKYLCSFRQHTTKSPWHLLPLVPVFMRSGHETKKHVLIGFQTWRVLSPNIWSLTAVKQTVAPDQRVPLISIFHFSQLAGIFLAQKQRTCLQKVFLASKNACKEYFVKQNPLNQVNNRPEQPPTPNFECLAPKHVMFAPN